MVYRSSKLFWLYQLLQLIAYTLLWGPLLSLVGFQVAEIHAEKGGKAFSVMVHSYKKCMLCCYSFMLDSSRRIIDQYLSKWFVYRHDWIYRLLLGCLIHVAVSTEWEKAFVFVVSQNWLSFSYHFIHDRVLNGANLGGELGDNLSTFVTISVM